MIVVVLSFLVVVLAQWQSSSIERDLLGSISSECWPFHFPLFSESKCLETIQGWNNTKIILHYPYILCHVSNHTHTYTTIC